MEVAIHCHPRVCRHTGKSMAWKTRARTGKLRRMWVTERRPISNYTEVYNELELNCTHRNKLIKTRDPSSFAKVTELAQFRLL